MVAKTGTHEPIEDVLFNIFLTFWTFFWTTGGAGGVALLAARDGTAGVPHSGRHRRQDGPASAGSRGRRNVVVVVDVEVDVVF